MAGGVVSKDPKNKYLLAKQYSPEYQQNISPSKNGVAPARPESRPKFSLSGILGLNQTVELHRQSEKPPEIVFFKNHLVEEQKTLFDTHQAELQREVASLRQEIQQLIKQSSKLDQKVEIAAIQPIVEVNSYQISFLRRLRILISNFRRNVSEAGCWLDVLKKRKNKKNAFWGNVKNKKTGGEQLLFSNESSLARSAN